MENDIPPHILREMEMAGVLPVQVSKDANEEPKTPTTFEYNMPVLDVNGEPPL